MKTVWLLVVAASLLGPGRTLMAQGPDPFVGRFHHPRMDLELVPSPAGYQGWLLVGGDRYELAAHRAAPGLRGTFRLEGQYYEFTGKPSNQGLTLWLPIAQSRSEIVWRLGEFKPVRYEFKRVAPPPDSFQLGP